MGSTLDRWNGKKTQNALVRGRQLFTQLSICEGRIALFGCCGLQKLDVSQNCCVSDVLKFTTSGSLEELLRY
jgi:hypothetical protein